MLLSVWGPTMASEGLYEKYEVFKDDEPVHPCFVLRPDRDRAAQYALLAYARHTPDARLAKELREWVVGLGADDEEMEANK